MHRGSLHPGRCLIGLLVIASYTGGVGEQGKIGRHDVGNLIQACDENGDVRRISGPLAQRKPAVGGEF